MTDNYNTLYDIPGTPLPQQDSVQTKPVQTFAKKEQILAYSSILLGFLFVRLCCYHVTGVLTTLLFWLMFTLCILYLKKSGKSFQKNHKALACVLYVFAVVYTITANSFLKFLCTLFLLLVCCLFVHAVCHPEGSVFRWLPFTMERAVFSHPFGCFTKCPAAAISGVRSKAGWKNLLYVLAGLVITIPLTGIVAMLLCNADEGMADMLDMLLEIPSGDVLVLIPHVGFGILLGCFLFSMLFSNVLHKVEPLKDADCERRILSMRILPNPMVYAAVTPICILYILFFVSQFQYFLGGFTGELSEGYTYAEYARKGFFELCAVCCINFCVIGVMSFGAKLCGAVKPIMLKIYTLFLSVCSLILAGTAMAKMFLYINTYGMTQLRVYTTWFMVLLIIGFVLILIRQFRFNLPVCRIGFILFTVMFGLLCFSRPDAWMVYYNAEMYIAGHLGELDMEMIDSTLSDDAAAILSTYQNGELAAYNAPIDSIIQESLDDYQNDFYTSLNLSAWIIQINGVTAK